MGADIGGIDIAHCVSRNTGRRSTRPDSTEVARIRYEREQRPIDGTADHDAAQFSRLHSRRRVASGRLVPERDTDINLVIRSDENRAWLAKLIPGGDEIAVLVENLDTAVEAIGNVDAGDLKVERFGWTFAPGDKVMQIENDYDKDVYNGDIGYIDSVDIDTGELTATFDGRSVTYGFGELDALVPAYAASIHKSQGSEYPAVVIPVMTQHYPMLQRSLLYTGVTRGKKLVVLVGQKKAVAIAVRNVSGRRRWSKLSEWLHRGNPQALTTKRTNDE